MKVDMVSTWCISGFVCLAAGWTSSTRGAFFSRQSFFPKSLPYHLSKEMFFQRRFFLTAGRFYPGRAHSLIVSSIAIVLLSATSQESFGGISSYLRKHITIGGYPFIRRTTNRCATHVLKHPGYWCYPGVESRSLTGAWAGRCVIAHLDDCWGPSRRSLASSHRTWHR